MDVVSLAVMDLIGRHQAETGMMVVLIVPGEEAATEVLGVLDAAEAPGELGLVFQGLEVSLRERVVVGGVGPAVRPGDAEVGQHQGGGLGLHGAAGVEGRPGGTACFSRVSSNSAWNRVALSASATHQPTTRRLKMSRMT